MVTSTPRPHFTPGKDTAAVLQEAGWASGPAWTGGKSRRHRDTIPNRHKHTNTHTITHTKIKIFQGRRRERIDLNCALSMTVRMTDIYIRTLPVMLVCEVNR